MSEITKAEYAGGTRYVLIRDLYQSSGKVGKKRVGKVRIAFFIPKDKEDNPECQKVAALGERPVRTLAMDALFFDHIERGWVDWIVNDDDIPQEALEALQPEGSLIVEQVNKHLSDNTFGLFVA